MPERSANGKWDVGFAANMTPEEHREVARRGAKAAHETGMTYKFDHDTAVRAAKKAGSLRRQRVKPAKPEVSPEEAARRSEIGRMGYAAALATGKMHRFTSEEAVRAGRIAGSLKRIKPVVEEEVLVVPTELVNLAERVEIVAAFKERDTEELAELVAELTPVAEVVAAPPVDEPVQEPPAPRKLSAPVQSLIERIASFEDEARRQKQVQAALQAKLKEMQDVAAQKRAAPEGAAE